MLRHTLVLRLNHTRLSLKNSLTTLTTINNQKKNTDSAPTTHKASTSLSAETGNIKNEPFIKKLFCGKYQTEYLKFPGLNNQELDKLNEFVKPIESYFFNELSLNDKIENYAENIAKLKQFQLFSLTAPKEFGGLEADSITVARVLESIATKPGLAIQLLIHNEHIVKALYLYGTQQQQQKYLPQLTSGNLKAAFCFSEPHTGIDAANFKLIASIDKTRKRLILNGKKSWVSINGEIEQNENILLLVLCKVINENQLDGENFDICSLLVEKNSILDGNIEFKKQLELVNGLNLYEINFDNVCIEYDETNADNITRLGNKLDSGYEIATNLYENSRHLVGAVCVGMLKSLFKTLVEYTINTQQFERSLQEFQIIKERLCKIECRLYAMESMTYLTAGIVDSYEISDVALECALTKIYCTESLKKCVDDIIQVFAMNTYFKLNELQLKCLNSIDYLLLFMNTNDVLRHYVTLHGASSAAAVYADKIRKLKDPHNNLRAVLNQYIDNLKLNKIIKTANESKINYFNLSDCVHPSLIKCANDLEVCSIKFIKSMQYAFIHHGNEIVDYQLNMKRLTEMSLEIFLMNCVIARCSRSYSIGLHNCDFEFYLTIINCYFAKKRFDFHHNELINTQNAQNVDNLIVNMAERAVKEKKHTSTHCLSRSF